MTKCKRILQTNPLDELYFIYRLSVALSRYNTDKTKLVGVYVCNIPEVLSSTRNSYIKIHIQWEGQN